MVDEGKDGAPRDASMQRRPTVYHLSLVEVVVVQRRGTYPGLRCRKTSPSAAYARPQDRAEESPSRRGRIRDRNRILVWNVSYQLGDYAGSSKSSALYISALAASTTFRRSGASRVLTAL